MGGTTGQYDDETCDDENCKLVHRQSELPRMKGFTIRTRSWVCQIDGGWIGVYQSRVQDELNGTVTVYRRHF